jgi:SpoVK/Ycf46/Vps4 family AAA+-type ATPase
VVKVHEQEVMARVPWKLRQESPILPGQKVLYDASTRFLDQVVNSHSDGDELLTDLASLDAVSREHLGAPHPILDDMMFRIRQGIMYAHWAEQMGARISASYLFSGPTGTGKTMHLKVLAREVTDFLEDLTGERTSPLITVDANSFYSPLFGSTENKIHSFFERLRKLGAKQMTTREGDVVTRPLIVVLEECEALLRSRGEMGGSGHLFDRPLSLILQKISSLGNDIHVPVYFVATTNRPDLLDAAARRRIGIRHVVLGTLTAAQAASVMETKLLSSMKFRGGDSPEVQKQDLVNQVLNYLYAGDEAVQGIAEIRFLDNNRRTLCRRHLVTGAMLEEAVSAATDDCLKESAEAGELVGIDAQGVIRSLESQYRSLAGTLRAHNLPEYCPQWFADEPLRVEHVRSLVNRNRRPASWAMH